MPVFYHPFFDPGSKIPVPAAKKDTHQHAYFNINFGIMPTKLNLEMNPKVVN